MSALLQIASAAPIDWSSLIPLEDAAPILGKSPDHLSRLCREQLSKFGSAVLAKAAEDRVARWYLRRNYDQRLARDVGTLFQVPKLDHFPRHQVDIAWQRAACVDQFRDARATCKSDQRHWLPALVGRLRLQYPGLKISDRSLRRWYADYRVPADIVKLIDTRGGNQKGAADPAAWDCFRTRYLDQRQPSLRVCWEFTRDYARAESLRWCSEDQCRRLLDRYIAPEVQAQFREPKTFRQRFAAYIPQDPNAWEAGICWIGDHVTFDLHCRLGDKVIRPTGTFWMDWKSRRIVGFVLCETPSSSTIRAAMRAAMLDTSNMGGPDAVWIDNGKDYQSAALHEKTRAERREVENAEITGLFGMLQIDVHFSRPYNPNGKGRLERWFGYLHDRFDRTFPTYCGKDSVSRPESLNDMKREKPQLIPTFQHVQERLADFTAAYNASNEHSKEDIAGLSPDDVMATCPRRRQLADPAALNLLLQEWNKPVRVGRNGVTIAPAGLNIGYGAHEMTLRSFKGSDRLVRVAFDPNDLGKVRVFDERFVFLCEAPMNKLGGYHGSDPIRREDVKAVIKMKESRNRARGTMQRTHEVEYLSAGELLARKAGERRKTEPTAVGMKIIQTPVDGQSKKLERQRARMAAGAESASNNDHDEMWDAIAKGLAASPPDNGDDFELPVLDLLTLASKEGGAA